MKENFNTLRQRATQIKNEVEDGANTSARVGSFCEDVVDTMTGTITEYNVSVQHPTSGIDGSNKYSLESAIAQVPQELRNIGLKVSFINSDGKVETWEFQGGTFTSAGSWKQIPNQAMIERIDNDIFNLNADKIDIDGTYDKEITLELSPSAVWQSLENIFPEGKDCTIHIDNPNKQTIFLAFSSVSPYQGQQYFHPDLVVKGMNHETISRTGKTPNRSEYTF